MNLVYIHQVFRARCDAGNTRTYEHAHYLADQGHRVVVIAGAMAYYSGKTPSKYRGKLIVREEEGGITILRTQVFSSYTRGFFSRLRSFFAFMIFSSIAGLRVKKCDVVMATLPPLTVGIPGYLISRFRRVPFVFEVQDLWPESAVATGVLKNRLLIKISETAEHFFYRKATKVVALTQGIRQALLEQGIPENKVDLVSHGAGVYAEPDNPQAIARALTRLGQNPAARGEMGMNGRRLVEAGYVRESIAQELEESLLSCVQQ